MSLKDTVGKLGPCMAYLGGTPSRRVRCDMSLKPQPSRPLPEDVARLGAILLPADSPYRLIGDHLYAQYDNAAFADLYPAEGKPALPPVDLLFVLALQALEDLSDRAAAEAVRL